MKKKRKVSFLFPFFYVQSILVSFCLLFRFPFSISCKKKNLFTQNNNVIEVCAWAMAKEWEALKMKFVCCLLVSERFSSSFFLHIFFPLSIWTVGCRMMKSFIHSFIHRPLDWWQRIYGHHRKKMKFSEFHSHYHSWCVIQIGKKTNE